LQVKQKFNFTIDEENENLNLPEFRQVKIEDHFFIEKVEIFLRNIRTCIRIVPDNRDDIKSGAGSGFPSTYTGLNFGNISICTTRGNFLILLSRPLALKLPESSIEYPFYSWGISQLIDDVVFQETGKHLPHEIREWWTGESDIREEKYKYEYINFYNQKK
jgi:hypothetical protein